jgi:uncharacterized membrane protein
VDTAVRSVPAGTLAWLEGELEAWQAEGRVDTATADGIRARYTARRQFSLARLGLGLGGAFLSVGVVWLVAANLDELSPGVRFGGVVLVWLAAVVGAEALAPRSGGPAVAALRLLGAAAFGAVVFQAAQSLQVPAYAPHLLGTWGAGALLQAYAVRAVAPLLVGLAAGAGWGAWEVGERAGTATAVALALLALGLLAAFVAVVHGRVGPPRFAGPWRTAGAVLTLVGLFVAALPADHEGTGRLWALLAAAAAVAAGAALALARDLLGRLEVTAAAAALGVGWLVVLWQPPGPTSTGVLTGEALLRVVTVVGVYLLAALWTAALGVLHDDPHLTALATGALVLFTVVQSFAVFAPVLSGATLFLALGAVLAGSGWVADRGRRGLVSTVREVAA